MATNDIILPKITASGSFVETLFATETYNYLQSASASALIIQTAKGATGSTGATGPQGIQGPTGPAGSGGSGSGTILNGTGFVKATGTTISYDNSVYLTTSTASATYLTIASASNKYLTIATASSTYVSNDTFYSLFLPGAKSIVIDQPTAGLVFPIAQLPASGPQSSVRFDSVVATIMGGGTVTFNLETRNASTLNTSGSNILTSSLTATTTGASSNIFSARFPTGFIVFNCSAITGSPTQIVILINYSLY